MSHPPKKITVVLADDHSMVRGALAAWLNATDDIAVLADVTNADDAITACLDKAPDVLVLDIDMPGLSCFDAARTIRARAPSIRIIFLSAFFHDRYIQEALAVEASGYLTKGEPPQMVESAIRLAASGGVCFSAEVQSRMVIAEEGARLGDGTRTRVQTLTQRELEILRYLARGMSKKEIAQTMSLSVKTVDNHCTNLMMKLDIHDRVEITRFAIREGLAEP
jgi:DNA-binding NarL/FixJ family response regulator